MDRSFGRLKGGHQREGRQGGKHCAARAKRSAHGNTLPMHWDMKHMVAGNHARILELHTEYAATSSFGHESDARRRDAPSIRTLFCFCGVFGMCAHGGWDTPGFFLGWSTPGTRTRKTPHGESFGLRCIAGEPCWTSGLVACRSDSCSCKIGKARRGWRNGSAHARRSIAPCPGHID
jgi:hypothetical protein